jgi:hypothetical protein
MPLYEYVVVPAPDKAPRVKGLKGNARFAYALQEVMNELAQDGWEYYRAESLPDEERRGFMGNTERVTRNVLVFRREVELEEPAEQQPSRLNLLKTAGERAPVRTVEREDADRLDTAYGAARAMPEATRMPVFRRPVMAAASAHGLDD